MCVYKAVPALGQLLLLSLFEWMSLTEAQECRQLLPLPNLNADAIVIGELVQHRADQRFIDIAVVDVVNGAVLNSEDCWRSLGNERTLAISTSTLPRQCSGVNTEEWIVGKQYILSLVLSIGNATACPSLLHDGLHSPILPAYPPEERARLRRQSSVCK
jgi:hypothetical protein